MNTSLRVARDALVQATDQATFGHVPGGPGSALIGPLDHHMDQTAADEVAGAPAGGFVGRLVRPADRERANRSGRP